MCSSAPERTEYESLWCDLIGQQVCGLEVLIKWKPHARTQEWSFQNVQLRGRWHTCLLEGFSRHGRHRVRSADSINPTLNSNTTDCRHYVESLIKPKLCQEWQENANSALLYLTTFISLSEIMEISNYLSIWALTGSEFAACLFKLSTGNRSKQPKT